MGLVGDAPAGLAGSIEEDKLGAQVASTRKSKVDTLCTLSPVIGAIHTSLAVCHTDSVAARLTLPSEHSITRTLGTLSGTGRESRAVEASAAVPVVVSTCLAL